MIRLSKLVSVLLACVMVLSLTACSGGDSSSKSSSESQSTASVNADYPFQNPLTEPLDFGFIKEPEADLLEKIVAQYNKNSDTIGWLRVPGTDVNDAVVQATNNEYYMRLDENKQYRYEGCLFADYENTFGTRDELSRNTIIYGHNVDDNKNGEEFAQLIRFRDMDVAKNNPYIYFSTVDDDMVWKIFAVFDTDTSFKYIKVKNTTDADIQNMINESQARSEFIYDVDVTSNDKLLFLSTCTYRYGGVANTHQRFVVAARLVRPGEDISSETVDVKVNPSIKKPTF